jgi:hypothetical protein
MGLLSILIISYFWLALLVPHTWQPVFPGAGFVVVAALLSAIVMSAVAGTAGSRRWYFVTAAALGTFLFLGLRMH